MTNVSCSTNVANNYYNKGLSFTDGIKKNVNLEKAFIYFSKAAELEHLQAICLVADSYHRGSGISISREKALEYYKLCAKTKDFNHLLTLAYLYSEDNSIDGLSWYYLADSVGSSSQKKITKEWQSFLELKLNEDDLIHARKKYIILSDKFLGKSYDSKLIFEPN